MKSFKFMSMFAFGLLLSGMVMAQEADPTVMAEPMLAEEIAAPVPELYAEMPEMDGMIKMHEDCPMAAKMKMGGHEGCAGKMSGDCPMKKMWSGHHGGYFSTAGILFKILHCLGMLIGLFLAAFFVRRGWMLGEKCPFKCCFSKKKCCSGNKECKK